MPKDMIEFKSELKIRWIKKIKELEERNKKLRYEYYLKLKDEFDNDRIR